MEKRLRRRTLVTVGATLGVVAIVAGGIALASMTWGGGSPAAGDDPTGSPSPSSSPSPTPPSGPMSSTLINVGSEDCATIDPGWLFTKDTSAVGPCDEAPTFSFAPQGGGAFTITYTVDGESGCLNWSYGDDEVGAGGCDPNTAWTFEWRETKRGLDVWQIKSVNNDNFCLAANGDTLQAQNCTDNGAQSWYTTAAKDDAE